MAPEQLAGEGVSVSSDIYALGLILYELFTGKRAFEAHTPEEMKRLQDESTPVRPSDHVEGLDSGVESVILRCLEKDPAIRPASALTVAGALPGGDPLAHHLGRRAQVKDILLIGMGQGVAAGSGAYLGLDLNPLYLLLDYLRHCVHIAGGA